MTGEEWMNKQEELIEKIKKVKHDFSKLIPTTMELMFDACIGILCEEFSAKIAEIEVVESPSLKTGLMKANIERQFKHDRELVLELKKRIVEMYSEVKRESEKNKDEKRNNKIDT